MTIYEVINNILSLLKNLNHKEINRSLFIQNNYSNLQANNKSLVEIKNESINLIGKKDLTKKLITTNLKKCNNFVNFDSLQNFFLYLKDSIIRLNHLGISYSCKSINKELSIYKKLLEGTTFKIYEEATGNPKYRWFFIGNVEFWEEPLFEIVISERENHLNSGNIPHFQIDIDTQLSIAKLKETTSRYIKPCFFDFEMNIPNHGVTLAMGNIGNIEGIDILLGLGTDLRDTKYIRRELCEL